MATWFDIYKDGGYLEVASVIVANQGSLPDNVANRIKEAEDRAKEYIELSNGTGAIEEALRNLGRVAAFADFYTLPESNTQD